MVVFKYGSADVQLDMQCFVELCSDALSGHVSTHSPLYTYGYGPAQSLTHSPVLLTKSEYDPLQPATQIFFVSWDTHLHVEEHFFKSSS